MTKEEAAEKIRLAITVLNSAIRDAARVGVRIEDLDSIDATSMEDLCPAIIYNAKIITKEYL